MTSNKVLGPPVEMPIATALNPKPFDSEDLRRSFPGFSMLESVFRESFLIMPGTDAALIFLMISGATDPI